MSLSTVVVGNNEAHFLSTQICVLLDYSVTAQDTLVCENSVLPGKTPLLLLS